MLSRLNTAVLFGTCAAVVGTPIASQACFMRSPLPVQVWLDHIDVNITDQVAVKTYDCTFKNANARAVVGGTCYMELEPGSQVDDMSVLVDGKEVKAEILDVDKANKVFQDLVQNGGSPALLEYYGNQLIQTQVPRIAPNSTVTVKLTYTTVLPKRGGVVRLQMLNTNPKALMQPLKSASVTVNIKSTDPIKNIYSPTHKVAIVEKPDWDVAVEWSQENYMPKHPFVLYYQVSDNTVGANLIAHREEGEDGHFMLMLSPTIGQGSGKVTDSDILPKDVVFCVDTSGSMLTGSKMEQARGALQYCVESLRAGDRFNIVDFSTVARNFSDDGLVELTDESQALALKYVQKLRARGGTAIQEALENSLKQLSDDKRLKMIVFATDGLPTIGERNPEAILKSMVKENQKDVRIFVFGEGYDVNTKLLDFLALDHRGEADYILPDENIEEKISRFFDRVGSPIMSDLEVKFDGLKVDDVYPRRIRDIFNGEQVVIYGRYSGEGQKTVKLTGLIGGEKRTLEYSLDFPKASGDDKASFVPRLWGGKKVDFLLKEIRQTEKPDEELVTEVRRLALKYGIVTPYTSYLMADDLAARGFGKGLGLQTSAAQPRAPDGFGAGGGGLGGRFKNRLNSLDAPSGEGSADEKADAVKLAKKVSELRREVDKSGLAALNEELEENFRQSGGKGTSLSVVRYIGTKTFYKSGKEWREGVFETAKDRKIKEVEVGSDEFFKLLKEDGRIAKYLALGDVVVEVKKQWYRFVTKKS